MVQIIQERKKPSFKQELGVGILGAIGELGKYKEEQQFKEAYPELANVPRQYRDMALQAHFRQKEQAEALQGKRQQNELILRSLEEQRGLQPGSLQGYVDNPAMAERVSKPQTQKAPLGGLAGTPVDPREIEAIRNVIQQNPQADPEELELKFMESGVSPGRYKDILETRRQAVKPVYEPESEKLEAKRQAETADRIVKGFNAASIENMRLDKQEALSKSGKLSTPLMVKTLESVGLPLSILGNPATEEYAKVEADYVRDVSQIFPGQIRNFEIASYMKTIPSLMNSPEGQAAIIRNRRILNEGKKLEYQAYKDIIKENGGKKPPNMDILIEERIGPQREALAEEFRDNMQEQVEKFESKFTLYDDQGRKYEIPASKLEAAIKSGLQFR